jgi:hypothetical protein
LKTKIGVFVDKEWQFYMYLDMFHELLPDAKVVVLERAKEARIESETHRVLIYGHIPTIRGLRFDSVISLVDNPEINQYTLPMLNRSKYLRKGEW